MSGSVYYFWHHCPQWLFQWFIGGTFYVVVCIWSFTEFIRIIIKLSKIKQIQLSKQNNVNNKPPKSDMTSHLNSEDFNMSYNFNLSIHKQMNDNENTITTTDTLESKTYSQLSNYNNMYPTKQPKDTNKPSKSNKIRVFGSRSSQKAFLIVIFFQSLFRSIECLSIAFIKKITSSENKNCSMSVIDSITGSNSIWYMYCESLGSLLFPMAFSCLAYQLAKIYYRFNIGSIPMDNVQRNIYSFLYILIIVNTICFIGTFILLFWIQFDTYISSNDTTIETYMVTLYSVMCIILSICYARFAFPIYKMYRRIMFILNHKTNANTIIAGNYNSKNKKQRNLSIKSIEDGNLLMSPQISEDKAALHEQMDCNLYEKSSTNDDGSLLYSDYYDIYQLETHKNEWYMCCCIKNRINYYDQSDNVNKNSLTKVKMPTDAQMFYAQFIASMKRTWIVSFYCGMAFLIRAIILFIPQIRNWYENKVYIHALYFLLLEILPIFAMLYIYGNATKSIGKH